MVALGMSGAVAASVRAMFPASEARPHVGRADIADIHEMRELQHRTDIMLGGGAMQPTALIRRYRRATALLDGRIASDATRSELHSAVAHYGAQTSWMLVDQGRYAEAQRMSGSAFAAAKEAGANAPALQALILGDLARQSLYLGQPRTALEILTYADALDGVSQDARAVLRARRARACGQAGDEHGAHFFAERAEEDYHAFNGESAEMLYGDSGFGLGEIQIDIGHACASLVVDHNHDVADAADRMAACMTTYGPSETRSLAMAQLGVARIHVAQQEPERALAAIRDATPKVRDTQSAQLNKVASSILPVARRRGGMGDVIEAIRELRTAV